MEKRRRTGGSTRRAVERKVREVKNRKKGDEKVRKGGEKI